MSKRRIEIDNYNNYNDNDKVIILDRESTFLESEESVYIEPEGNINNYNNYDDCGNDNYGGCNYDNDDIDNDNDNGSGGGGDDIFKLINISTFVIFLICDPLTRRVGSGQLFKSSSRVGLNH